MKIEELARLHDPVRAFRDAQRQGKRSDPHGLLNPGKLIAAEPAACT